MGVDREKLLAVLELWNEIADSAAASLAISGNRGMACVVGTLRSRGRTLTTLADGPESRAPNSKDDLEIDWALSTVQFLRDTDWVRKDIGDETLQASGQAVEYGVALASLVAAVESASR